MDKMKLAFLCIMDIKYNVGLGWGTEGNKRTFGEQLIEQEKYTFYLITKKLSKIQVGLTTSHKSKTTVLHNCQNRVF